MTKHPLPLYFDYAATTPLDPVVAMAMIDSLQDPKMMGNAASDTHYYGEYANHCITQAQQDIKAIFNAKDHDIIFTSGATESINLALKGAALAYQHRGQHIITVKTEHKATLDTCKHLETLGFSVTYLPVLASGLIDLSELSKALQKNTILVSIMHVNNETGTIQQIDIIEKILKNHQAIFHIDGAQSAGKLPINLATSGIDLFSLSAHKFYGPKGAGLLIKKPNILLKSQIHGGTQQNRLRAGTLPTQQIIGLSSAITRAQQLQPTELKRLEIFRNKLWETLHSLGGIKVNGDLNHSFFGIMNICIDGVDGEALLMALHRLALSQGSACSSVTHSPSHVLKALGLSDINCQRSIRLSLGRFTTDHDINVAKAQLTKAIITLRKLSPFWPVKHEVLDVKP